MKILIGALGVSQTFLRTKDVFEALLLLQFMSSVVSCLFWTYYLTLTWLGLSKRSLSPYAAMSKTLSQIMQGNM